MDDIDYEALKNAPRIDPDAPCAPVDQNVEDPAPAEGVQDARAQVPDAAVHGGQA